MSKRKGRKKRKRRRLKRSERMRDPQSDLGAYKPGRKVIANACSRIQSTWSEEEKIRRIVCDWTRLAELMAVPTVIVVPHLRTEITSQQLEINYEQTGSRCMA